MISSPTFAAVMLACRQEAGISGSRGLGAGFCKDARRIWPSRREARAGAGRDEGLAAVATGGRRPHQSAGELPGRRDGLERRQVGDLDGTDRRADAARPVVGGRRPEIGRRRGAAGRRRGRADGAGASAPPGAAGRRQSRPGPSRGPAAADRPPRPAERRRRRWGGRCVAASAGRGRCRRRRRRRAAAEARASGRDSAPAADRRLGFARRAPAPFVGPACPPEGLTAASVGAEAGPIGPAATAAGEGGAPTGPRPFADGADSDGRSGRIRRTIRARQPARPATSAGGLEDGRRRAARTTQHPGHRSARTLERVGHRGRGRRTGRDRRAIRLRSRQSSKAAESRHSRRAGPGGDGSPAATRGHGRHRRGGGRGGRVQCAASDSAASERASRLVPGDARGARLGRQTGQACRRAGSPRGWTGSVARSADRPVRPARSAACRDQFGWRRAGAGRRHPRRLRRLRWARAPGRSGSAGVGARGHARPTRDRWGRPVRSAPWRGCPSRD